MKRLLSTLILVISSLVALSQSSDYGTRVRNNMYVVRGNDTIWIQQDGSYAQFYATNPFKFNEVTHFTDQVYGITAALGDSSLLFATTEWVKQNVTSGSGGGGTTITPSPADANKYYGTDGSTSYFTDTIKANWRHLDAVKSIYGTDSDFMVYFDSDGFVGTKEVTSGNSSGLNLFTGEAPLGGGINSGDINIFTGPAAGVSGDISIYTGLAGGFGEIYLGSDDKGSTWQNYVNVETQTAGDSTTRSASTAFVDRIYDELNTAFDTTRIAYLDKRNEFDSTNVFSDTILLSGVPTSYIRPEDDGGATGSELDLSGGNHSSSAGGLVYIHGGVGGTINGNVYLGYSQSGYVGDVFGYTQAAADSSLKISTTAYVDRAVKDAELDTTRLAYLDKANVFDTTNTFNDTVKVDAFLQVGIGNAGYINPAQNTGGNGYDITISGGDGNFPTSGGDLILKGGGTSGDIWIGSTNDGTSYGWNAFVATQSASDSSNKVASTEYVDQAVLNYADTVILSDFLMENDTYIRGYNYAGGFINVMKISEQNVLTFGLPVDIQELYSPRGVGLQRILNMPGLGYSYGDTVGGKIQIGDSAVFRAYRLADGAGGFYESGVRMGEVYADTVHAALFTGSDFILGEDGSKITMNADSVIGGSYRVDDGTVNNPGLSFVNDTNSGFYRISDDSLAFAIDGSIEASFGPDGWTFSDYIETPEIKITTGAQDGYYLKSDASGNATWSVLSTGYKGTLDGSTGTPTAGGGALIDGTGTAGDYYRCVTAGTYDYGNPTGNSITLAIGDDLFYNGSTWEKVPGGAGIQSINSLVDNTQLITSLDSDANVGITISTSGTDTHTFDATWSGVLSHERGGLEADVSAYNGVVYITGGSTSAKPVGISNDNIVEIDDASVADNEYGKFTANGLEGRTYGQVADDIESSIDHTNIANIGTNSHAQIDTHIGDGTIHFTEGSIDHTAIANIGTNSHAQIDTHIADGTIHFTQGAISITASQVSDFDTEVSNNTDVAANTAARHDAVTMSGTPNYITLSGQDIIRGLIDLTADVTGVLPGANFDRTGDWTGTLDSYEGADFAILADYNSFTDGQSIVNATPGSPALYIRPSATQSTGIVQVRNKANDDNVFLIDQNGGITLLYGTDVNEFSTDGTLAGNSDDAVPTEKAIKAYVDALGAGDLIALNGDYFNSLNIAGDTIGVVGVSEYNYIAFGAPTLWESENSRADAGTIRKNIPLRLAAHGDTAKHVVSVAGNDLYKSWATADGAMGIIDRGFDVFGDFMTYGDIDVSGAATITGTLVSSNISGTNTGDQTTSSATTDQLTVATGSSDPELSIVTGSVSSGGSSLATGDQIYNFVDGYMTWGNLSGTPTTLAGYGIIDAYTQTELQTSGSASVHWDNITNIAGNVAFLDVAQAWTANQTFNDTKKILIGTSGADGEIYSDGSQTVIKAVNDVRFIDASGQSVLLVNNSANSGIQVFDASTSVAQINANGLTLENGTNIDEFSTDEALTGDSDLAVPTEQAVKAYVDNNLFDASTAYTWTASQRMNNSYEWKFGTTSEEFSLYSSGSQGIVEITNGDLNFQDENGFTIMRVNDDYNNSLQTVMFFGGGTVKASVGSSGFTLDPLSSATITAFSVDGTFASNSDNLVPTQQATKEYVDAAVAAVSGGSGTLTAVNSGAGMDFTNIDSGNPSGTVAMGTPTSIGPATTNGASGTTHTHTLLTVTPVKGGTGLTSIAAGSVYAANSANTVTAITSTSGTKVLKNVSGTIQWATESSGVSIVSDILYWDTDNYTPWASGAKAAGRLYDASVTAPTNTTDILGYDGQFKSTQLYEGSTRVATQDDILDASTAGTNPTTWAGDDVNTASRAAIKAYTDANGGSSANNYLSGVSGSGNGTVTFTRNGLGDLTWDASHTHSNYLRTDQDDATAYDVSFSGSNYIGFNSDNFKISSNTNQALLQVATGADKHIYIGRQDGSLFAKGHQDASHYWFEMYYDGSTTAKTTAIGFDLTAGKRYTIGGTDVVLDESTAGTTQASWAGDDVSGASRAAIDNYITTLVGTSGVYETEATITRVPLGGLATSPQLLIAAPGSGKYIDVISVFMKNNIADPGGNGDMYIGYGPFATAGPNVSHVGLGALSDFGYGKKFMDAAYHTGTGISSEAGRAADNVGVYAFASDNNTLASGDNVVLYIRYRIIDTN